jgi:hypothetical protein
MSKAFSKKIDNISMCQWFLDLLCFIAVSGVSHRWKFKSTTKGVVQNSRVEKLLQKKSTKKHFFLDFFYHVFWCFSVSGEGSSKTKTISPKNLTGPGIFSASEEPTNHPKARQKNCECPLSREIC